VKTYKNLDVWKLEMDLNKKIYEIKEEFLDTERYELSSQMRITTVSIPYNTAKGSGKNHKKEFVQYLYHSRGSLLELETQVELSKMLNYLDEENYIEVSSLIKRAHKIINGLIFSLKKLPTTNNAQRTTAKE